MSNSLTVLSVNLQKSHKDLKTILETTLTDVLLVQEPSWVCLVPRRSDTDLLREDTQGSVNHPQWNALFPPLVGPSPESRPLVATFLCKSTMSPYVVSVLPSFSSVNLCSLPSAPFYLTNPYLLPPCCPSSPGLAPPPFFSG